MLHKRAQKICDDVIANMIAIVALIEHEDDDEGEAALYDGLSSLLRVRTNVAAALAEVRERRDVVEPEEAEDMSS